MKLIVKVDSVRETRSGFQLQIKGLNIDVRKHLFRGLSNRITGGASAERQRMQRDG